MDATTTEELKAKHLGVDLILLSGDDGFEAVARITKTEVDLFREVRSREATKSSATERLIRACIVHPAPEELSAYLKKKPLVMEKWADKLLDEAGAAVEVTAKKL